MRLDAPPPDPEASPLAAPSTDVEAPRKVSLAVLLCRSAIRGYQRFLSPYLGAHCRFAPTCSAYAIDALEKYGLILGLAKASWRILRCNPLCPGGHDPA